MGSGLKNVERYRLQTCLKKAGRVETWKAIDTSLRRYVTIKLIHAAPIDDPGFLVRFTHETKALSSLHHPNIVRIQDARIAFPPELANPIGYIVMDYIDGPTQADEFHRIARTGKNLSVEGMVYLIRAIADAVDYAQQKGIVHGNIQPANIMLRKHSSLKLGEPVLTCFGTAKLLGTTPGVLCLWGGDLPLYLSPEQCQGHPANPRSDVYALGAMLYELYTAVPPFQGGNASEIMVQHIYAAPKPPILMNPAMPPGVSKLIMRCLEKAPNLRFATASALATALADALFPFIDGFPTSIVAPQASPAQISSASNASISRQLASAKYASRPASVRSLVTPRLVPFAPEPVKDVLTLLSAPTAWRVAAGTPAGFKQVAAGPRTEELLARTEQVEPLGVFARSLQQTSGPLPSSTFAAPVSASTTRTLALTDTRLPLKRTPRSSSRFSRKMQIALCLAFFVACIGSSLGAYFALSDQRGAPALAIVGQVSFVNSGPRADNDQEGVNNEILLDLRGIPPAGAGKSYYAWLLGDDNQAHRQWLLLGRLSLSNGAAHMLFAGDGQHSNLLAFAGFFLITQGDVKGAGHNPLLRPDTWRYYAELPQEYAATDSHSLFNVFSFEHVR